MFGQGQALATHVKSSDLVATESLERGLVESVQWFEVSPEADCPNSALRHPVVHESGYKQASGEAVYIDDMAPRQGMLHL